MIRIIGFIIIVVSSAKIGFDISGKYIGRVRELKSFIKVLEKLKNEINFSNCVVSEALSNSANVKSATVNDMVKHLSESIKNGKDNLCEAFNSYLLVNQTCFDKSDVDEIYGFLSVLGNGDREDEIKNISNTMEFLKSNLNAAIENERKYVKVFRTSGILAGCLIAIILA